MKIIKIQQGCQEKKVKNLASDPSILWTENKGETARKKARFWRGIKLSPYDPLNINFNARSDNL